MNDTYEYDLVGLISAIPCGIFIGRYLYKYYCKKKGIDFQTAIESNWYAVYQGSAMITIFLYFLIRALLGY